MKVRIAVGLGATALIALVTATQLDRPFHPRGRGEPRRDERRSGPGHDVEHLVAVRQALGRTAGRHPGHARESPARCRRPAGSLGQRRHHPGARAGQSIGHARGVRAAVVPRGAHRLRRAGHLAGGCDPQPMAAGPQAAARPTPSRCPLRTLPPHWKPDPNSSISASITSSSAPVARASTSSSRRRGSSGTRSTGSSLPTTEP
jgi:hypothetical protein